MNESLLFRRRQDVGDQRAPGAEHLDLDLVDLKLRQARRLTLDELLVERGELLEVGHVLAGR